MKKIDIELDPTFKEHLLKLGLKTGKEYISWCKLHGFSQGLNKTGDARKKELDFLKSQKSKEAFEKSKNRHLPLDKVIKGVIQNTISETEVLKDRKLAQILNVFKTIPESDRNSYLDFLLVLESESDLLSSFLPVIPEYNNQIGNTYFEALSQIFKHRANWLNSIKDWKPKSHNVGRQFSSLIRHLFTKYELPPFMDSTWFSSDDKFRKWFLALASGQNIRTVPDFPLEFTKRMAHNFLQAPDHYTMNKAIRWGQIMGMDGDCRLVDAINQSFLGNNFNNSDFWNGVINLFILNPMLDRNQVGPIVDYIFNQKYAVPAPQPNFCMKGRTADTLLKQTEEWHERLSKEKPKSVRSWNSTGIPAFRKEEGLVGRKSYKLWEIKELLTAKDLFTEGANQRHCVGSYSGSCIAGRASIWSLRLQSMEGEQRFLTIEVNNNNKKYCSSSRPL